MDKGDKLGICLRANLSPIPTVLMKSARQTRGLQSASPQRGVSGRMSGLWYGSPWLTPRIAVGTALGVSHPACCARELQEPGCLWQVISIAVDFASV